MDPNDELATNVGEFAKKITQTIQSVLGLEEVTLKAALLDDKFTITTPQNAPIVLMAEGEPLLDMKVRYECGWDFPHRYMAVDAALYHVFAHGDAQPLFRYEFVKRSTDSAPTAHLHVHAHRDAFTWAMTAAGRRSKRSKRRAKAVLRVPPAMAEVHFPLGGRRFRPALEDVLQMLVEEFGIEAVEGWEHRLQSAREAWRRSQIKAAIRDAPEDAAIALRELGYNIAPPDEAVADNEDALRQY
jgi:hypothetical protein